MSLLQRIKNGKKNYKLINFPGTEEKVALRILSSAETTDCKLKADQYIKDMKIEDEVYQDIILQQYIVYNALRDKDDIDKKVAESIDEIRELENSEIMYFMMEYNLLVQETSPFLSSVTEEQLEELKKTLEKMTLKDLSGESLVALRNFLMSLQY